MLCDFIAPSCSAYSSSGEASRPPGRPGRKFPEQFIGEPPTTHALGRSRHPVRHRFKNLLLAGLEHLALRVQDKAIEHDEHRALAQRQ